MKMLWKTHVICRYGKDVCPNKGRDKGINIDILECLEEEIKQLIEDTSALQKKAFLVCMCENALIPEPGGLSER